MAVRGILIMEKYRNPSKIPGDFLLKFGIFGKISLKGSIGKWKESMYVF